MARKSSLSQKTSWSILAAREHMETGGRLTYLEAMVLFGIRNFTIFISRIRHSGTRVDSQVVPYAKALRRLNQFAKVEPPKDLPIRELRLTEYWIEQ